MARVVLNPIFAEIHGQVGDLVLKEQYGETVMARKATSTAEPTANQVAQQDRFRLATIYGKVSMADADLKARYQLKAEVEDKPIFSLMVADFFNAPSVDEIDLSAYTGAVGDVIGVKAHDDFEVVGIRVALSDGGGTLIEDGNAVEVVPNSGQWEYTATQAVPSGTLVRLAVTAKDTPGGTSTTEAEKTL